MTLLSSPSGYICFSLKGVLILKGNRRSNQHWQTYLLSVCLYGLEILNFFRGLFFINFPVRHLGKYWVVVVLFFVLGCCCCWFFCLFVLVLVLFCCCFFWVFFLPFFSFLIMHYWKLLDSDETRIQHGIWTQQSVDGIEWDVWLLLQKFAIILLPTICAWINWKKLQFYQDSSNIKTMRRMLSCYLIRSLNRSLIYCFDLSCRMMEK